VGMSWLSPKTAVRDSRIQGRGLFAAAPIGAGEIVAVKGGHVFDGRARARLERELGPAEIQIGEDLFIGPIDAVDREGAMIFSNHSCEPNIGVQGQVVFVALRDILPGEELTHDWAMTDDDDGRMECRCGTASCRGTVTGRDWRRPDLQDRYRGYFSWYLARKIERLRQFS
jgi:SET domain-containing protein